MDDDTRYRDLLRLIGDQRRDFQAFEARLLRTQLEHWKAVAGAIRTLSDWWTKAEDTARKERIHERNKRNWQTWVIIALLLILIIGGTLALLR